MPYLRIIVDGIQKELSVKRSCDPAPRNTHASRASGTKENVKAVNNYLEAYLQAFLKPNISSWKVISRHLK